MSNANASHSPCPMQLRDVLMEQVSKNGNKSINILPWLSRMTLEVIGLAGKPFQLQFVSQTYKHRRLQL